MELGDFERKFHVDNQKSDSTKKLTVSIFEWKIMRGSSMRECDLKNSQTTFSFPRKVLLAIFVVFCDYASDSSE